MAWFFILYFLLVCSSTIYGDFIFPSKTFTVCTYKDSQTTCTPKLSLIALFSPSSTIEFEFTIDESTPLIDEKGRKWAPDTPITVQISRDKQYTQANYFYLNSFRNAYESKTQVSSCSGLTNCCYDSILKKYFFYSLLFNSTVYDTYAIRSQTSYTTFRIIAVQNAIYSLTLEDTRPSASLPGIQASIVTTPVEYSYQFLSTYLVTPKNTPLPDRSYLIHRSFFGSSRNQLGMSTLSYYRDCTVGDSISLTTVLTNNRYNQLDGFSSGLDVLPNCNLKPSNTFFSSTSATVSYTCNNDRSAILYMDLITNGTNFKVKKLFGDPIILDSGMIPFSLQDTLATIFVDVMNKGSTLGVFSLQFLQLCLEDDSATYVCTSDQNIPYPIYETIQGISTKRMQTRIKTDVIFNQKGYYNVQLLQDGYVEWSHQIFFNTKEYFVGVTVANNRPCLAPNFTITVSGITYCRTPCPTIDTYFEVTKLYCVSVDCRSKYSQTRNYFNPITMLCEPVTICNSNTLIYDSFSNTCKQATMNTNQTSSSSSTTTVTTTPNITEWYNSATANANAISSPKCGTHGFATKDNTSCICELGWITNALTAQQQGLFCTDVDYYYWRSSSTITNNNTSSSSSSSTAVNIDIFANFFATIQDMDPVVQLILFIGFVIVLASIVVGIILICLGCCVVVKKSGFASSLPNYILRSAIRYQSCKTKELKAMTRKEKWRDFFKGLKEVLIHNVTEQQSQVGKWWKQKLKQFKEKDVPEHIVKEDEAWKQFLVEMIKEQLEKRNMMELKKSDKGLPPIPPRKKVEEDKLTQEILAQITKTLNKYHKS